MSKNLRTTYYRLYLGKPTMVFFSNSLMLIDCGILGHKFINACIQFQPIITGVQIYIISLYCPPKALNIHIIYRFSLAVHADFYPFRFWSYPELYGGYVCFELTFLHACREWGCELTNKRHQSA